MSKSTGNHNADPAPAPAATKRCDMPIDGMSCASCAARIEKRLANQPGVASASVNFATKVATVKYDPAATGPAKLAMTLRNARGVCGESGTGGRDRASWRARVDRRPVHANEMERDAVLARITLEQVVGGRLAPSPAPLTPSFRENAGSTP